MLDLSDRLRRQATLAALLMMAAVFAAAVCVGSSPSPSLLRGRSLQQAGLSARDIQETKVLGTAIRALNATGVAAAVNASSPATIFAPTDSAFKALAKRLGLTPAALLTSNMSANITMLHVIPGVALSSRDIHRGSNTTLASLLGPPLLIQRLGNNTILVSVEGSDTVAQVVYPNLPFNTSIVHVINKVLLPP